MTKDLKLVEQLMKLMKKHDMTHIELEWITLSRTANAPQPSTPSRLVAVPVLDNPPAPMFNEPTEGDDFQAFESLSSEEQDAILQKELQGSN